MKELFKNADYTSKQYRFDEKGIEIKHEEIPARYCFEEGDP